MRTSPLEPNPVRQEASARFAATIAVAVREGRPPAAVYERALAFTRELGLARVAPYLERAAHAPPADLVTNMGHVVIALENAFYAPAPAGALAGGRPRARRALAPRRRGVVNPAVEVKAASSPS